MKTLCQSVSLWAEIGGVKPVPGTAEHREVFSGIYCGGTNPEVRFLKQYGMWQSYCSINFTKTYLFHFAVLVSKNSFGAIAIASLAFCEPLTQNSSAVVSLGLYLGATERNLSVPRCQRHAGSVPPASEALAVSAPLCSGGTSWCCSVEEHFFHVNPDRNPQRERQESFSKATVTWSS